MKLVAQLDDIPEGGFLRIDLDGRAVALHREGREVHAIDPVCPHRGGPLDEGGVEDGVAVCPWHGWAFEVRTGKCQSPKGARSQAIWEVHVVDESVYIDEDSETRL